MATKIGLLGSSTTTGTVYTVPAGVSYAYVTIGISKTSGGCYWALGGTAHQPFVKLNNNVVLSPYFMDDIVGNANNHFSWVKNNTVTMIMKPGDYVSSTAPSNSGFVVTVNGYEVP